MPKKYLDVSRYQGRVDWPKVRAAGYEGVMLKTVSTNRKLSSRKDGLYIDPTFERNYQGAKAAGLAVGAYYYTYATTRDMADAELALLKTVLVGKTFELPICVDVEENKITQLGKQELTDLVAYALGVVESWGVYAMLYTGLYFGQTNLYMGGAALKPYDVWLARYPKDQSKTKPEDKPKTDFPYGIWQYTGSGRVPGISGDVDLDWAYKDYAGIIQRAGLTKARGA